MKKESIFVGVKMEVELKTTLENYAKAKKTTMSKIIRSLVVDFLIKTGKLPKGFQDEIKLGGDRLKGKLATADVEEQKRIKDIYDRRAARARAAKAAKTTITISGTANVSGGKKRDRRDCQHRER